GNRFSKPVTYTFAAVGVVWLLVAGFVFYNTQILNPYKTSHEQEQETASFEKKYKKYQKVDLPKITGIQYFIDLYPKKRNVKVKAVLQLKNKTDKPLDSLHFVTQENWETAIDIPHADLVYDDDDLGYQIYALDHPLQPGDSL